MSDQAARQIQMDSEFELKQGENAKVGDLTLTLRSIRVSPMQQLPNGLEVFPQSFYRLFLQSPEGSQEIELGNGIMTTEFAGYNIAITQEKPEINSILLKVTQ